MAKIREIYLRFTPSGSSDVVSYALYSDIVPTAVTYENSTRHDLGMPSAENDELVFDMSTLGLAEGDYNFGLVAIDDVGNESSMDLIDNVPLDLTAPDAPSGARVVRS